MATNTKISRMLPRWAWYTLGMIGLVLLLALIMPVFLNVDRYRGEIASAIEKETGRKATIGKISARFLPSPKVVVSEFRLSNPPGLPEGELIHVDAIYGSLAWGPLIRGEIQVTALEISHPLIVLLENEQGRTNYDFGSSVTAKSNQPDSGEDGFRLSQIGAVKVTNAEVEVARTSSSRGLIVRTTKLIGLTIELQNISLEASRLKEASGVIDLAGVKLELGEGSSPFEFRSGKLTLSRGAAEGEFRLLYGKVADLNGSLKVGDISSPKVVFGISTPLLDLNALPTSPGGGGGAPSSTPARGASELVAEGKLKSDKVRFTNYELSKAAVEIKVFTDRVEISPFTASAYGGELRISGRLDRRTTPERFSANVNLQGLSVEQLLAASSSTRGKMTGTGSITLALAGSLGPPMENSVAGSGNFSIVDGRFPGLDLGQTLGTLNKVQEVLSFGSSRASSSNETTYRSIAGDLILGGGRVASKLIRIDSSVGLVELSGSSGFDSTLDYRGRATLTASGATGGAPGVGDIVTGILGRVAKQDVSQVSVPFTLAGTFENPQFRPGGGLPAMRTTSPTSGTTQQQPQKKSLLDFLKRP